MAGQNLEELIKKLEKKVVMLGNELGQAFSLKIEVSLAHDYYWTAIAVIHKGDFETGETIEIKECGLSIEEALNNLTGNLIMEKQTLDQHRLMYEEDLLWGDIGDLADQNNMIELPTLRNILEKYNILKKEKGM